MSKQRLSASVDADVHEYLTKDSVNASGLINELVKNRMKSGGGQRAMLELREKQLESDVADLENRAETKRKELAQVREELSEYESETDAVLKEAVDELEGVDTDPSNPAIQRWADKAGVAPPEFADRLDQLRST